MYGDFGHGQRTMPVSFSCHVFSAPTSFDVPAHQPYAVARPTAHAVNADVGSIPDIGKLTKLLRAAERRGAALPRGASATRSGSPRPVTTPTRRIRPASRSAPTLAGSSSACSCSGGRASASPRWYLIRDEPPARTPGESTQTGVYYLGGQAKPAALAYRFPVVGHGRHAWIRAPASGTLVLQAKRHRELGDGA